MKPIVASFKGKVSLFAKNLDTGETYALNLMKREQGRNAIGRSLYNVPMASKYGALDRLRSAVAILYTPKGKIAMAISCDDMPETMWSVDNPAYLLMSRLSEVIAAGLEKK